MPTNRKMTRARAWQLCKKKKGLCQQCGARKARKLTFNDGSTRVGALCQECDDRRRNAITLKLAKSLS